MIPPPLDPGAALFIDVDGTLLEIAPRPDLVRVPPGLPTLLGALARQHGGALALVSGRRIADLDALLAPWRGPAAGVHGAERRRADGTRIAANDPRAMAALARAREALGKFVERVPGLLLEDKGHALAAHYRLAPENAGRLRDVCEQLTADAGGKLRLIAGKMVFELQPRDCGKGGAIAAFMAEAPFAERMPVFLGDDTTDEDGFAEVNRRFGLSIRVGPAHQSTAATYRLATVADVYRWLSVKPPAAAAGF